MPCGKHGCLATSGHLYFGWLAGMIYGCSLPRPHFLPVYTKTTRRVDRRLVNCATPPPYAKLVRYIPVREHAIQAPAGPSRAACVVAPQQCAFCVKLTMVAEQERPPQPPNFVRELFVPEIEPIDEEYTWDSTYRQDVASNYIAPSSVCSHAVAFGHSIFALDGQQSSPSTWIWKVTIDPRSNIQYLSSNDDGSIIAAATTSNKVVLLRGLDGKELARNSESPYHLEWIDNNNLWMKTSSNLILVSNIDGRKLNHENDVVVSTAVNAMKISVLPVGDLGDSEVLALLPSLRAAGCDENGCLVLFDGINEQRISALPVAESSPIQLEPSFGLKTHFTLPGYTTPMIVGTSVEDSMHKIFWFNPNKLQNECFYAIDDGQLSQFEPIRSIAESTCAVAAVVKTSSKVVFHILQLLVDENGGVKQPHILYTIQERFALSADIALGPDTPLSFRYKVWNDSNDVTFKSFQPEKSHAYSLASLRSSVRRGQLDSATEISARNGNLMFNEHTDFHPSEISFEKIKVAIKEGKTDEVQSNLAHLASAGVASEKGLEWLLTAVDYLRTCPTTLPLPDFLAGIRRLSAFFSKLSSSETMHSSNSAVGERIALLENQAKSLDFLISKNAVVKFPFNSIRSLRHLYTVLITESSFGLARQLCLETEETGDIDTESIIFAFTKLGSDVQPKLYFSFIRDVVFPRLVDGDRLLYQMKGWSCRTADLLDSKEADLEAAIALLEVGNRRKMAEYFLHRLLCRLLMMK